ncbi:histidine phosphatase family protein [Subtercola boreus]|uniref:Histidine phosphatase family protein n=1 Tax=Subtercola boreus TaxID=120213 RepID=A0A3E0WCY4_9MICO|nr:histidine phosphatase family protein [Subtercola boreus]RFA21228.1 histidine phosphatase family protein [Subtercola boreus]RFA21611.1 histidine phosphatase family protein [Subtercola boreus]RFA27580.1 histidine phosphatase family protein [Subtercola boreus]
MTHLALVRHGQTDWNLAKRIQGSTDIPLNDTGRAEARATAAELVGHHFDAVLTSPLGRARETAGIIAAALDLPGPIAVAGLVERNYGEAEGLDYEELHSRFPEHTLVPGRESHRQVQERVHAALIEVAERRPGQSLVVVCHGGVISSLVRFATDGARPRSDERIPNGSVHWFGYADGELTLDRFNGEPVTQLALQVTPEAQ